LAAGEEIMRYSGIVATAVGAVVFGLASPFVPFEDFRVVLSILSLLCIALTAVGVWDMIQPGHSLKRNYPILANIRFFLEKIRPEIRQYFLESETDGTPFNRAKRSVAYQRAKGQLDKRPFGTQQDIYASNFEWINHSIAPRPPESHNFRIVVGGPDCKQPYSLSLLNISAMSFGALSAKRDPRAQQGGEARRVRARHRRRRLQQISPRVRRRHHLGTRQRLFRVPQ
jgi:glutamate synthase domain-containing protein 2